jgi:serine/threonine protein kinase
MDYTESYNLRQHLNVKLKRFDLSWHCKKCISSHIINCLNSIHRNRLIHRNLHCGNIFFSKHDHVNITDVGLCQPASAIPGSRKIYGVLPYVAPEVLRGRRYTQASDIYSFGIIAYEVYTGLPPYHDVAHDEFLAIRIIQGLRPELDYKVPREISDIIKQCWDADPLKRPKAKEICELFEKLKNPYLTFSSSTDVLSYTTHPQAIYTSRLLDFKNISDIPDTMEQLGN